MKNNVSPTKLGRQKEQSLAQYSESINCKVTKGNIFLNHTRKTPATRSDDFFTGKLSVKNSNMLNSNIAVLPELSKSTNHLVFKTDINYKQSGNVSKSHHLKRDLMILHQNIRGLNNKSDEMAMTIATNPPHVLCFIEHHLKTYQLHNILFQNYKLGAKFCRNIYKNGGVCVYIYIFMNLVNFLI
jgi:hypothetical protein